MNVLLICLDTLRWDALGCYGSTWVQTPAIDAYAARAQRFTAAYCGSFPTVPMRVDAYTGDVNWPRYGWRAPDATQPKLPALLRRAGYRTGLVLDTENNVGAGLHTFYDEYQLIRKDVLDGVRPADIPLPVPAAHIRNAGSLYRTDRANWSHYRHEEDWFVARTMRTASRWLETAARRAEPWFLWVDSFEIHEDYMPPRHYVELYDPGYDGPDYTYPNSGDSDVYTPAALKHLRACYAGEVTLTDRWVGHLLRTVELLGLFANTTVILTSDHGMYLGEHGRCGKHTVDKDDPWPLYDTVARVPLLVWSPLAAGPGTVGALVQAADLMPTVLDVCGVPPPDGARVGRSWAPALRGAATGSGHERVYTSFNGEHWGMPSHLTVTTPTHTALFGRAPHQPELYDRRCDPEQMHNVAAAHPDLVAALRADLVAFMQAQGASADYVRRYALGQ